MGKGKDMMTAMKNLETTFGYSNGKFTKEGVLAFFKEYRSIKEMCMYSYDANALDLLITFEQALMSDALLPQERVAVALIYGLELTYMQAKKIMGIKTTEVQELIDNAFEAIEAVLNGYKTKIIKARPSKARNVNEYMQEINEGCILIFDVTDDVFRSLLFMTQDKDQRAKETIMQYSNGNHHVKDKFNIMGNHVYNVENYTYFRTSNNPKDYDFFRSQDKHFGVQATEHIEKHANGLTVKGKRTVSQTKRDETSNGGNGKGLMY